MPQRTSTVTIDALFYEDGFLRKHLNLGCFVLTTTLKLTSPLPTRPPSPKFQTAKSFLWIRAHPPNTH